MGHGHWPRFGKHSEAVHSHPCNDLMYLSHGGVWSSFPLISFPPSTSSLCSLTQPHSPLARAFAVAVASARDALPPYISMANSLSYFESLFGQAGRSALTT